MRSEFRSLLQKLSNGCFAARYWPHVPLRLRGICESLREKNNNDFQNGLLSSDEADADNLFFPLFVAFFSPPASATAIRDVLDELKLCLDDALTINEAVAPIGSEITGSFTRFRHRIFELSMQEPDDKRRPPSLWPHLRYALYRLHIDCRDRNEYRPLALKLTLRLHLIWIAKDRHYFINQYYEGKRVEGLDQLLFAKYALRARRLIEQCEDRLGTLDRSIRLFGPKHFEVLSDYRRVEELARLLFRVLDLTRGHLRHRSKRCEPTSEPAVRTTYGPLPSELIQQSMKVRVVTPPAGIDSTAIPQRDLQELEIEDQPVHPDIAEEPSLKQFVNRHREIRRAQIAIPSVDDIRILQMPEYRDLIRRLPLTDPLHNTDTRDLIMSTFVLTVMFLGQNPQTVFQIDTIGLHQEPRFEETEETVNLVYAPSFHTLNYTFPENWLGYTGSEEHPFLRSCIPTTRFISLPLFPPLADLFLECFWRNFSNIHRGCEHHGRATLFRHLDLPSNPNDFVRAVDAWLGQLEPPDRPGRWTLARLAESFFVQVTQRFDMDPIIALWVSGQWHWSIRSPSQYTAFPGARLFRELQALFTAWWEKLDS